MADVAAVLNILLTANATQANAQLAKTQTNLTATQRKAEVTGAAMKKAMLGVGVAAAGAAPVLEQRAAVQYALDPALARGFAVGRGHGPLADPEIELMVLGACARRAWRLRRRIASHAANQQQGDECEAHRGSLRRDRTAPPPRRQ